MSEAEWPSGLGVPDLGGRVAVVTGGSRGIAGARSCPHAGWG
jgi:hypothetical protein